MSRKGLENLDDSSWTRTDGGGGADMKCFYEWLNVEIDVVDLIR